MPVYENGYYDGKGFNPEVFAEVRAALPDYINNRFILSSAVVEKPQYAQKASQQFGQDKFRVEIMGGIGGEAQNYDGSTDLEAVTRATFNHIRTTHGRMNAWKVRDFSSTISGGIDYQATAAEVNKWANNVNENDLFAICEGLFKMSGDVNEDFVETHTYTAPVMTLPDINHAAQKALGDNRAALKALVCHSNVAKNLENINATDYVKYTDPAGFTRDTGIPTVGGKAIIETDSVPVEYKPAEYIKVNGTYPGALAVVASGAKDGQVNKADVTSDLPDVEAGDYVVLLPAGPEYTSYLLTEGAFEYTNGTAVTEAEVYRDPFKAGGESYLIFREWIALAPVGISFVGQMTSPTAEDFKNGENWAVAKSKDSAISYPLKGIGIVQIKTRG